MKFTSIISVIGAAIGISKVRTALTRLSYSLTPSRILLSCNSHGQTDTVTSAPSPAAALAYSKFGDGEVSWYSRALYFVIGPCANLTSDLTTLSLHPFQCADVNNSEFSTIELRNPASASAAECSVTCGVGLYHSDLVGFSTGDSKCWCFYSGGVVPSIPPPANHFYRQWLNSGNGPVGSTRTRSGWECYVYSQVGWC